ncbi:MAG: radical SAM protein [Bacteroidota bacterium]|nr:radical SAM protein [Bacteroidota bacterium]
MRILMIYPEYPDTFWSYKHALPFVNKKSALPPLGLLTVSSLLPEDWEKKLIDLNVCKLKNKDIEWADMVFISGMIVQKQSTLEIVERVKSYNKFIVAGGPLFTTAHAEFSNIDCFVLNEGEITIPLFLEDLKKGEIKPVYSSQEKPEMSQVLIPDWSLIKMKDYASMPVQISRGCPFNCEFCDIIVINGRIPRFKTPEQVIAEFNALYNSGWRGNVFIVDDNFIGNKNKAKLILAEIAIWMKKMGKPFILNTEASINLADDKELLELMQRSNFNSVFVGIETPEEEGLISCGKTQNTNKDLVEKVKIIHRHGMQVSAGFIVGFDTDTVNTFDNMIKFIQKSGIVTAMVGLLNALPETQLYKRLQDTGRILKTSTGNNTDATLNFTPVMDKDLLIEGYNKVLNSIFRTKNYYKRTMTFLKDYKKCTRDNNLTIDTKLRALTIAFWKLGIAGHGRRGFWKMMIWTTFRRPQLLAEAVTMAIYGFHYRAVMSDKR